jgi:hypothetical protein
MRLFGVVALAFAVWPASSRADWFCSASEPWRQPVERLFSAHDDTYIITGIPSSRTDPKQVKFQFSFKFDLTPNEGPCGLFFAYTQRSLWNAYAFSSPFEDTSYNPQLFLTFGLKDLNSVGRPPRRDAWSFSGPASAWSMSRTAVTAPPPGASSRSFSPPASPSGTARRTARI